MNSRQEDHEQENFWKAHYDKLAIAGPAWLDYGNARTQRQSLSLAIDTAQPVASMRCADIGCGRGQLALALLAGGATQVVGADASSVLIRQLEIEHTELEWIHYGLVDAPTEFFKNTFDRVFSVEVLQYVPLSLGLSHLWQLTAPGGRLTGIVPNGDCPFLAAAIKRFSGHYAPPSVTELRDGLARLPDVAQWHLSGMWYTQQSQGVPYRVDRLDANDLSGKQPNRLLFTAERRS